MKKYIEEIKKKLEQEIKFESIKIVDNSYKHKNHKFFSSDKLHLKLQIKSSYLETFTRINAQKLIMNILREDLKKNIHALEIKFEK